MEKIDTPPDLRAALDKAKSRAVFDAMSPSHRREWIRVIEDAKRPGTREKRVAECVEAMQGRPSG